MNKIQLAVFSLQVSKVLGQTDRQRTGNVKNPIPGTERGAYANAAPSTITGVMPEARPIYSSKYPSKLNFGCVGFKNTLCRR